MKLLTLLSVMLTTVIVRGQSLSAEDPLKAEIIYSDIDAFWTAFEKACENKTATPFETYLSKGSQGVKDFIPYRIISADSLYRKVIRNKKKYEAIRESTHKLKEKEKQISAAFFALEYLYPKAVFPPTYFVIGRFNSGGTSSPHGLIIGAEMQGSVEGVPYVVAHELIHFQ